MFTPELIHKINLGRCFALVGSGPSSEVGYPSWEALAKKVWAIVLGKKPGADTKSFDAFMTKKDYPAVFRQAEVELGGRSELVAAVRSSLTRQPRPVNHPIYEYLARWPFACYLTTNYDDEIKSHLASSGVHYSVVQNKVEDLALLRDGVSHLILKLHSDLDHPNEAVLTSQDYDRLLTSPKGQPFRDKLRQAFEVFDILIVGHSITDPDLQLVLATAKHTASPVHPIYMLVANATAGDEREFLERYNIRLIDYEDTDGAHRELKSMIQMADRFIASRGDVPATTPIGTEDEIATASSLLIFRRLRTIASEEPVDGAIGPLVLKVLAGQPQPMTIAALMATGVLASLESSANLQESVARSLNTLVSDGLARTHGETFSATPKAIESLNRVAAQRKLEESQAYGQFELSLRNKCPGITTSEIATAAAAARNCIVGSFRARGLSLASIVIAGQTANIGDMGDIFREVTKHARQFSQNQLRTAFVEATRDFLVEPNEPQRKYLAAISQGFFLYHLTGKDPSCAQLRRNLFSDTSWFLDSSVLLPLLAKGCHSHDYARDLFARLARAKASLFTTQKLLREAWQHLRWAMEFVKTNGIDSPAFLRAANGGENFKQNLFLDGYIRLAADGQVATFKEYLESVAPQGASLEEVAASFSAQGIRALQAEDLTGFEIKHWGDIEEFKNTIAIERKRSGTWRSEFQTEAEAEVLAIIRRVRSKDYALPGLLPNPPRVYFVSQSRALDKVSPTEPTVTWSPEALYRYVTALPGTDLNPDLLQQCMLHEYYYAGISFIDKPRYTRFFGPSINQARTDYREQVDRYLSETEQSLRRQEYDEAFDRVPDLEKPFFVSQMGWQLAAAAEQKARQLTEVATARITQAEQGQISAEQRAKAAEEAAEIARKKMLTAQHEANRQRNLTDTKHLKKRERQAKRRARRNRK